MNNNNNLKTPFMGNQDEEMQDYPTLKPNNNGFNKSPLSKSPHKQNQIIEYSLDNAQLVCGNGHTYQKKAIFVTFLQYMAASILAAGWPLLFENPKFYCFEPGQSKNQAVLCDEFTACQQKGYFFVEESDFHNNVSQDYELYCDRKEWVYDATQIFVAGGVIGSLYYGYRTEKKGRLRVLSESMGLMILGCILTSLSFDIYVFIPLAVIIDFGFRGFNNTSQVLLSEQSSENLRRMLPSILMSGWAIGQIFVSLLSKAFFDWKIILLVLMGLPLVILYFNQTKLQDSPRYLVVKKQFREAREALMNIAKKNERDVDEFILQEEKQYQKLVDREKNILKSVYAQTAIDSYVRQQEISHNYLSLFNYSSLRSKTLAFLYIWGVTTLSYFTTMLEQRKYIEKDITFHLSVAGILELISYLIYMNLSLSYYRKMVVKNVLSILGAGHLAFLIIPMYQSEEEGKNKVINYNVFALVILSFLRVVTSGFVNSFMYVYLAEVFPTSVRHLAFGFFNAWTKFMWLMAPILAWYFDAYLPTVQPLILVGILLFIGVWFVRKLRETLDETGLKQRSLPDYLEEELENLK